MSRDAPNPTDQTGRADLYLTDPPPATGYEPRPLGAPAPATRSQATRDPSRQLRLGCGAAVLLGFGLCGPVPGVAETVTLNSESAFLERVAEPYYVERFDGYVVGSPFNGTQISADFGPVNGYSWTVSTNNAPGGFDGLYSGNGNLSVNDADDSLFITFTGDPVTAVGGLFRTEDVDGSVLSGQQVIVRLEDGTEQSIAGSGFRGFVSSVPIAGMRIRAPNVVVGDVTQTFVWPSMDNFYVGAVGPSMRWNRDANGNWDEASNWDPERVPDEADITLFQRAVPVEVDLGSVKRSVLASRFEGSGVTTFVRGELEIAGSLSISDEAEVRFDNIDAKAGVVNLGDRLDGENARLVLERDTVLDTGSATIGARAKGRVDINDSGLFARGDLTVGFAGEGRAAVDGNDAVLNVGGRTFVGRSVSGYLDVKRGGSLVTTGPTFIGGDDSGDFLAERSGSVDVESLASWDALGPVRVGGNMEGTLRVTDGGEATLFDGLTIGYKPRPGSGSPGGAVFVGPVTADSVGGFPRHPRLTVRELPGLVVGATGGYGLLFAGFGGQVIVENGELVVATGGPGGGRGLVGVQGVADSLLDPPVRATLKVGDLNPSSVLFECYVGSLGGRGDVQVQEGGHWICPKVSVGGAGQGRVVIDGAERGFQSQLDTKQIVVGASGELVVQSGGEVTANQFVLGPLGTLLGNGSITALQLDIRGYVSPGLALVQGLPLVPLNPLDAGTGPGVFRTMDFTPATISTLENGPSPSTLTLVGNVVLTSSAVIELDVWGPGIADRLEVDGTLQIDGATLVLNFPDGYLPSEGDLLDLIAATGGVNGSFGNVVFNGLGPGFEYRIDIVNGAVSLTALNDATEDDGAGGEGPGLNPPPVAIPTLSQVGLLLLALMLLLAGFRARGRSLRG